MISTLRKSLGLFLFFLLLLASCHPSPPPAPIVEPSPLTTIPPEYQAGFNASLAAADKNQSVLVDALTRTPQDQRAGMAWLISMTGRRYTIAESSGTPTPKSPLIKGDLLVTSPLSRGAGGVSVRYICDAAVISSTLLLNHIKLGYEALRQFPWAKELDEDTFRKYVLTYRMTTEELTDWRTYFWNNAELRTLVNDYAQKITSSSKQTAMTHTKSNPDDQLFRELIYRINSEWLPRYDRRTSTDQTNKLIGILRTFGMAATSARCICWPERFVSVSIPAMNDGQDWAVVYDPYTKEWLDIDPVQPGPGEISDPAYFHAFVRNPVRPAAKVYWVTPGAEQGAIWQSLQLKGDETYPPLIDESLVLNPVTDMTEWYNDVTTLKVADVPADSLLWLCVFKDGEWKPIAGARSENNYNVIFPAVGVDIRYRLATWRNGRRDFGTDILIPSRQGTIETVKVDPPDYMPLFSVLYGNALDLMAREKYAEARAILLKLLQMPDRPDNRFRSQPNNLEITYLLTRVAARMGYKSEALDYLDKAITGGFTDLDMDRVRTDAYLANLRAEDKYKALIGFTQTFPELAYPLSPSSLTYAIVVSRLTKEDPNWRQVVNAFSRKYSVAVPVYRDTANYNGLYSAEAEQPTYSARIFLYDHDPAGAMNELISFQPRYVAFIAQPTEVTRAWLLRVQRMMTALDADPYDAAVWGIITGYDYQDCLRMAAAEPLAVRKLLNGNANDDYLKYFPAGLGFSYSDDEAMYVKEPGGSVAKQRAPLDVAAALAAALNSNDYQMMVTTGRADEHNWQIGYTYQGGSFFARAGNLFSQSLKSDVYPITTTNSKIYLALGNSSMAGISDRDSIALAWLHSGVNQFCGSFQREPVPAGATPGQTSGIMKYFTQKYCTLAEAVYYDKVRAAWQNGADAPARGTVLYGDPAWEARAIVEDKAQAPDYTVAENLVQAPAGRVLSIDYQISFTNAYNGVPIIPLLPSFLTQPQLASLALNGKAYEIGAKTATGPEVKVLVHHNLIMIDAGQRQKGDVIELTFKVTDVKTK